MITFSHGRKTTFFAEKSTSSQNNNSQPIFFSVLLSVLSKYSSWVNLKFSELNSTLESGFITVLWHDVMICSCNVIV